jgi:DNA-binding HxlR family transcriptional regulator
MRENHQTCYKPCPVERGMRIIGNKWTGSILWHLKDQPMRFNEIARQLAGKPVAVQYKIAARGLNALTILEELKNWTLENDL